VHESVPGARNCLSGMSAVTVRIGCRANIAVRQLRANAPAATAGCKRSSRLRKRITTDTNSYFRHRSTRTPLALRTPFGIEGRTCISADRDGSGSPKYRAVTSRLSAACLASRSASRARASSGGGRHLGASIRSAAADRDRDPMANLPNSDQPSYSAPRSHRDGRWRGWRDGMASVWRL
jgi:hypothetical protein